METAPEAAAVIDETESAVEPVVEPAVEPAVEQELLIEEISIDGMCGVY